MYKNLNHKFEAQKIQNIIFINDSVNNGLPIIKIDKDNKIIFDMKNLNISRNVQYK